MLATRDGRKLIADGGFTDDSHIVACEWNSLLNDVLRRVYEPRTKVALVAIRRDDELHWLAFEATSPPPEEPEEATIGNLFDLMVGVMVRSPEVQAGPSIRVLASA